MKKVIFLILPLFAIVGSVSCNGKSGYKQKNIWKNVMGSRHDEEFTDGAEEFTN